MAALFIAATSVAEVSAADLGGSFKDAPAGSVVEYGRGWMIRGRILGVVPDEDTSISASPVLI